jgi:predicted RNA-binding Zn ribbon-like protein
LAASIGLRDTLEALLAAPAARQAPLEPFNAWLARAPERARLTSTAQGYSWLGGATADDVLAPIWPVVWSAADLLVSGQTARVRSCANRHCAWLFINQRRRWCSMEDCGNRAKARRHYRRHRAD